MASTVGALPGGLVFAAVVAGIKVGESVEGSTKTVKLPGGMSVISNDSEHRKSSVGSYPGKLAIQTVMLMPTYQLANRIC